MSNEFDEMIRQVASQKKKVDISAPFQRDVKNPLEGEELERETSRLFGEYLRWRAYDRQRRKNERARGGNK